ncbi:hypothetical protein SE17_23190, partial [Kouleothrix aurantiaca]
PAGGDGGAQPGDVPDSADCFATPLLPGQPPDPGTLDLQPLIDADTTFNLQDYPPGFLAPFRQGAGLYGLPYTVSLRALAYNRDAFDAAGVAYPAAGWTPEDMLRAAQQLTNTRGDLPRYGFADADPQATLAFVLSLFGAKATNSVNGTLHANLTDPNVVSAARFYAALLHTAPPRQSPRGVDLAYQAETARLRELGQVGMWLSADISQEQNRAAFAPALAPLPGGAPANAGIVNPIGLSISPRRHSTPSNAGAGSNFSARSRRCWLAASRRVVRLRSRPVSRSMRLVARRAYSTPTEQPEPPRRPTRLLPSTHDLIPTGYSTQLTSRWIAKIWSGRWHTRRT